MDSLFCSIRIDLEQFGKNCKQIVKFCREIVMFWT